MFHELYMFIQVHDSFQCRHFVFQNDLFISETLPNSSLVRFGNRDEICGLRRWVKLLKDLRLGNLETGPHNGSVLVEGIWDPENFKEI